MDKQACYTVTVSLPCVEGLPQLTQKVDSFGYDTSLGLNTTHALVNGTPSETLLPVVRQES